MVEKRISHEGFKVKCDKCPGEFHSMKSTTKTVTIGGKPIVTEMDKITVANIPVFSKCSGTPTGTCTPILTKWIDYAEPTVNTDKFIPLVEHSELICTKGGGYIGFEPEPAKSEFVGPPKPNIVDKAKAKINGMANKAANMAKKVANGVAKEIEAVLEGLKPIGQLFDNPEIKKAIASATSALEQANLSKEQLDETLSSLEKKVPEIKSKISGVINDIEIPSLEELGALGSDLSVEEASILRQGIIDSTSELNSYFNNEINTKSLLNFDGSGGGNHTIPSFSDKGPLERWLEQKKIEKEHIDKIATKKYDAHKEQILAINKDATFDDGEDSKKALAILESMSYPSQAGRIPIPGQGEIPKILKDSAKNRAQDSVNRKIDRTKGRLNVKLQSEFDEKLKKLGYDKAQKKIDKAQAESAELQKDMDKASKWLGRMDDFGGYIDGLKKKYNDRIAGKLSTAFTKTAANLGLVNVAMDGMSFVANGLPPGDVVTNVKPKKEKPKEEEPEEDTPPPPPPPEEPEKEKEEEEEKETDECKFTKLTAIKNDTLEHLIYEKKEGDKANKTPLPKPIQFVAGTTNEYKSKLSLIIEGLKQSNSSSESSITHRIDGTNASIKGLPGSANKLKSEFDIIYNPTFMQRDKLLLNFMGLAEELLVKKHEFDVQLCNYQNTVMAEVLPDAEWTMLFALGSDDPLTYIHGNQSPGDKFNKHQDKARRIGNFNSKKLNYGHRTASFKFVYGVTYNKETNGTDLSITGKVDKIYGISKQLFGFVGAIDKLADKLKGNHTSDDAVSIAIIPPSIFFAAKHKIIPSDTLFYRKSEEVIEFGLDPLLGCEIEVDLVRTGEKRFALMIFISKVLKYITDRKLSDVFFFTVGLSMNFKLIGKLNLSENSSEVNFSFEYALKISMGFHIEGSFWGIEYEAELEGSLAGGLEATARVGNDNNGLYTEGEVDFKGIKGTILIRGSVSGWIFDDQIEKQWSGVIGKWDAPIKTPRLQLS